MACRRYLKANHGLAKGMREIMRGICIGDKTHIEYDKSVLLYEEGAQAVRAGDWDKVEDIAAYNVEMGSLIIRMYEDKLPLEVMCRIALCHYTDKGDFSPTIRKYVRKARIIRPNNWRDMLPSSIRERESFVVYRGGGEEINKAAYSLSWTLSQEMAEWFMKRHMLTNPAPQHLYRGIISADKVIAYINDRKEFEIVQYRGVKKIEEISPEGLGTEFADLKGHDGLHPLSEDIWDSYFDKWYSGHLSRDV